MIINITHSTLSVILCSTAEQISAVTGYSGGNIIINYKYEMNHENHEKYFCEAGAYQCFTRINIDRAAEWTHVGQFSVHDDRSARLLRVFIRELNENDSGEYKIIVKVSEDYSFFSEFKLDVKKDLSETTSPPSSSSSSSSSSPPSSSSSPPSSSSSSPPSSSSSSSSFSLVRSVQMKINSYASIMKIFRAVNNFSVSIQVSHTGCDYEEIKDTHKQLPTNPSVSSNAVYATAQLPTNPSDSSNDLNYAVVNFQKKADCPDRVSLRNNQDYSEYTAVNHLTA
uniref:Uncharacterized protein n=1 Tax=Cyprinus carpio carpio TaxID=630221 RepID=A0A9J7X2S4_CYPCA